MQRRWVVTLLICALFAALSVPVFAQDSTSTPEASATAEGTAVNVPPWVCPTGFSGQSLHIYNWSTYVAEDTISNFEKACGVTVTYDTYGSLEEMLAKISQGNPGYDILVPTGYYIPLMASRELLEPLDLSKIPNFANVAEGFKNPVYDPGNKYSVPYLAGTVGVGYNKTKVGQEITSWQQVWDYDGPVAWIDDPRVMLGLALDMLGFDPNTSSEDEINQARDYLIAHGKNVVSIAGDDGDAQLQRGDVNIAIEYMGDIFQVMANCSCEDFAYALPTEGSDLWTDNLVIPAGAPNPALAAAFIDYVLDPKVGADIANYTAYQSPNQKAIDDGLIDPEMASNPLLYPSADMLSHLWVINDDPDGVPLMNAAWDEVKVALSH